MKQSLFILILLSFNACDCLVHNYGYVIDEKSNTPIPEAVINFDNRSFLTDSIGYFEFSYITASCSGGEYIVKKEGYQDQIISLEINSDSRIYEVKTMVEMESGDEEKTSGNFKIRNDTLFFYLNPINPK